MPEAHLLCRVERAVDFSFIYKLCALLYSADNGRSAVEPEILFRMLLVGDQGSSQKRVWRRDQQQHGVQVVLRAGADRESAGCNDDQPKSAAAIPEQRYRGEDLQ